MAWLAIDASGEERIFEEKPERANAGDWWLPPYYIFSEDRTSSVFLKKGTIEKLIGYPLTWENEAVEY